MYWMGVPPVLVCCARARKRVDAMFRPDFVGVATALADAVYTQLCAAMEQELGARGMTFLKARRRARVSLTRASEVVLCHRRRRCSIVRPRRLWRAIITPLLTCGRAASRVSPCHGVPGGAADGDSPARAGRFGCGCVYDGIVIVVVASSLHAIDVLSRPWRAAGSRAVACGEQFRGHLGISCRVVPVDYFLNRYRML